jgi:S1-C subfamily serine protease
MVTSNAGDSETATKTAGPPSNGTTSRGGRGRGRKKVDATPDPDRPGRASRLRTRILPRSVLGIACLILALAVGAGFSGVVLYSYYQYKLNQTNDRVNTLITGYKKQFTNAESDLAAATAAAKASIQNQLKALQQIQAGPATLAALIKQVAPSVYFVHTLNTAGEASVGTAFVVSSNATQSLLLTSYTAVKAATAAPGPTVYVQQGNTSTPVSVRSWDPQNDLALLVLPQGGLKPLPAATLSPAPQPGDGIYAVSGLGSAGASISQGTIIDVSASGLTEDAAIGPAFQGGPLINQAGDVVGVASLTYAPYNFTTSGVWFAPYVEAACNQVLTCPGGTLAGSG